MTSPNERRRRWELFAVLAFVLLAAAMQFALWIFT